MRSRPTNKVTDEEKQQRSDWLEDNDTQRHRIAALECLFNLPQEQLHQWPGATAYCRYLEEAFQPLLTDEYAYLWTAIGKQRPKAPAECWQWFNAVCLTIRKLENEDTSIEEVWDGIRASAPTDHASIPAALEKTAGLVGVFSVLCWGTMTLQPRLRWADFKPSPSLMVQEQRLDLQGLKMDIVRRPIPAIFRNFQRTLSTGRWKQPIGGSINDSSTLLYVSTLNYASLKTIGKIRLNWVDNLSSHLDFNSRDRVLSIFRFPTFCALSTLEESRGPVFEGLTRALYGADADAMKEFEVHVQVSQEVLMSYRLLFGQTRGARGLAKAALKVLRHQDPHYDQLLELLSARAYNHTLAALPSSLWPIPCRSFEDTLQEEDAYSAQDDFPMFGQRLAKLQQFNLRQQPSKLRDLWRDRRNPLQWYTFWAVLIVGSLSLLLTLLQLIVAIAQLIIAS